MEKRFLNWLYGWILTLRIIIIVKRMGYQIKHISVKVYDPTDTKE